jgi:Putative transmembrane protein (PGPGW)
MLVIAGGLAIIATEFLWARRVLRNTKSAVARVLRKSELRDWLRRTKARWSKKPPHVELGGERPQG